MANTVFLSVRARSLLRDVISLFALLLQTLIRIYRLAEYCLYLLQAASLLLPRRGGGGDKP